mmetsp:Transcript_41663/g.37058  ORF Transcript_41663/g.37058 Transcript_41663/m.37058 type:complete len:102 (+) Transcript_41663:1470-1775(+)
MQANQPRKPAEPKPVEKNEKKQLEADIQYVIVEGLSQKGKKMKLNLNGTLRESTEEIKKAFKKTDIDFSFVKNDGKIFRSDCEETILSQLTFKPDGSKNLL